MPRPLPWNAAADLALRRMRADGASWDAIAASLGVSRWAATERGRAVGARMPRKMPQNIERELRDPGREPLRPGHPATWSLIALHGAEYPWPPLPVIK